MLRSSRAGPYVHARKGKECENNTGFRKYRGIKLSEKQQGLIYYTCQNYNRLSKKTKQKIERLCEKHGGSYRAALFELVTTPTTTVAMASKHFTSATVLQDCRKAFYEDWYNT